MKNKTIRILICALGALLLIAALIFVAVRKNTSVAAPTRPSEEAPALICSCARAPACTCKLEPIKPITPDEPSESTKPVEPTQPSAPTEPTMPQTTLPAHTAPDEQLLNKILQILMHGTWTDGTGTVKLVFSESSYVAVRTLEDGKTESVTSPYALNNVGTNAFGQYLFRFDYFDEEGKKQTSFGAITRETSPSRYSLSSDGFPFYRDYFLPISDDTTIGG